MSDVIFEWDEKKKHGTSFVEAQTAFVDDNGLLDHDPDHSGDEERFILLGLSSSLHLLVVCHAYRKDESVIRIISARKATRLEQEQYWKRW
jgi:uncharacterized DUF497 family protein